MSIYLLLLVEQHEAATAAVDCNVLFWDGLCSSIMISEQQMIYRWAFERPKRAQSFFFLTLWCLGMIRMMTAMIMMMMMMVVVVVISLCWRKFEYVFFSNWLFYDSLQLSLAYTKIRVYHTKLEITPPVYYILSFMVFEGSIITGVIRL